MVTEDTKEKTNPTPSEGAPPLGGGPLQDSGSDGGEASDLAKDLAERLARKRRR